MPRPSTGSTLNIAELEKILEERRNELLRLRKQRTDLEKDISGIDRQIEKLGGAGSNGSRRRSGAGSRARNEKSLNDTIAQVFSEANKAMRVTEIVEAVLATGYRSGSANFKGIVNQALIKDKRFAQVERGIYQLKK